MSAAAGPKLFHMDRATLEKMMNAHITSLTVAIEQAKSEMEANKENKHLEASIGRWIRKFQIDRAEAAIMLHHMRPQEEIFLTGTELIGIYRRFQEIRIVASQLFLVPPPGDGQAAERRLAATAAAVPPVQFPDAILIPGEL